MHIYALSDPRFDGLSEPLGFSRNRWDIYGGVQIHGATPWHHPSQP